jgi:hypothetical protein
MSSMHKLLACATLVMGLSGAALADTLAEQTPFLNESSGQQSDASTGAYVQTFIAPTDTIVEAIHWFGFHGGDSGGPAFDSFVVRLDGVLQTGTLTHQAVFAPGGVYAYERYQLDIADAPLTSGSLSIANDSSDVAWYWQSAVAVGNADAPSADLVAFQLTGRAGAVPPVPEPAGWVLLALGLPALLARAHWRRRQSGGR